MGQCQRFQGFFDGVGRGTRRIAHDGDILSRQQVDEAALAAVPAAEDADMGFYILCHVIFLDYNKMANWS